MMNITTPLLVMSWILCLTLLSGCSDSSKKTDNQAINEATASAVEVTTDAHVAHILCDEVHGVKPVCGFKNPEDLAVVPGGDLLLVSEMATFMSDDPGTLSFLNVSNDQRSAAEFVWNNDGDEWGDVGCVSPDPARLSPHGIDLITRTDGRHQLLVVNHGREVIEFFELVKVVENWQLRWKGCANPKDDLFMNDVAGLIDGGFFVTNMWIKSTPFDEVVAKITAGEKIGWVLEWHQQTGFVKVPGSDEQMPNGIAVSRDNSKIFVNIYMANKTIKVDRATNQVEAEMSVRSPDNVVVDDDGNLWVASHLNDPIEGRCEDNHPGPCLLPFQIVKADPQTMLLEVVFKHDGEPMGYATVGLPHRGRLYLGTASGDRLASVAISDAN